MKSSKYEYRIVTAPNAYWVEFCRAGSDMWQRLNFCFTKEQAEERITAHMEDDNFKFEVVS